MILWEGTDFQKLERELKELQSEMEGLNMNFKEANVMRSSAVLIQKLIGKDKPAKYFLRDRIPASLYKRTIDLFGEYTLEALLIYSLGIAFHSIDGKSMVRLSTLIGLIDRIVIIQANNILKEKEEKELRKFKPDSSPEGSSIEEVVQEVESILEIVSAHSEDISPKRQKGNRKKGKESENYLKLPKREKFAIGSALISFMEVRELIKITSVSGESPVMKKRGTGYIEKLNFVVCNFCLRELPLRFNLPMVCKPLDWQTPSADLYIREGLEVPRSFMLSDLRGGYLCSPSINIHWGLLSSHNLNNFNIELNPDKSEEMCDILNGLQKQGFKINKKVLEFIKKNRTTLEEEGLLMPSILGGVNLAEAIDLMRNLFFKNTPIQKILSLDALIMELSVKVQKALYADFIIELASAYDDFVFYLPAFMDFRGRIYRAGVLHFHERDLSRGLIVFANNQNFKEEEGCSKEEIKDIVATSAAFKYKKFHFYNDALMWIKEKRSLIYESYDSLISFAKDASEPFQFIAKVLCEDVVSEYNKLPITQDASASAYQIMSYLLLNEEMAIQTNLLPHPDGSIQDVYTHVLHDFKEYLRGEFLKKNKMPDKMEIIESKLDRKLIKSIFMPLIYGKTLNSIIKDIRKTYGQLLSREDINKVGKLSDSFWKEKYPDIVHLMKLIKLVGWFCSKRDRAVYYSIPYFTTKQDYMAFENESISVYEEITRKRRKATLRIPSQARDKRKTQAATCANFIHQKDAYISMKVIQALLKHKADIYTVHDNFITTARCVKVVPQIYTEAFLEMGFLLKIMNHFINQNLIIPEKGVLQIDESIPFTESFLEDILKSFYPDNETWTDKVKEFIDSYTEYVNYLGGPQVNIFDEKWGLFKKDLTKRKYNYSVHY